MGAVLFLYSFISRLVTRAKNALYDRGWIKPRRGPLPVISVGNITLGGTGKTPAAIEILDRLLRDGFRPALVTRGYRGKWERRGGLLSDGTRLWGNWRESGDEPAMVALRVPRAGVFVGRHRLKSCLRAAEAGFDVAVLDDGFQHRRLHRDLDIVLHDPRRRAALREPVTALSRADIILVPDSARDEAERLLLRKTGRPAFHSYSVVPLYFLKITGSSDEVASRVTLESLRGAETVAFCGLAAPERFFLMLERLGLRLRKKVVFPDHHPYPARSWDRIRTLRRELKAEAVVTTEKDAVKLAGRPEIPGEAALFVLRIGLEMKPEFFAALAGFGGGTREGSS
ncbi:MAG: tetraacyldisaccharide 4'-kinase [Candidatus Aminicenantes bacterium]|nr:tetraacyldisaccharide 4'-kinase [Candidatus Aminicenantes bacterium]